MWPRRRSAGTALASLLLGLGVLAVPVTTAPAPAAPGDPGFDAGPKVLATGVQLHEYDAAFGDGLVHVGWIASPTGAADRRIWMCRLPVGSDTCQDGASSYDPGTGGASAATSLRVLRRDGRTVLVWFHDTPASVTEELGSRVVALTLTGAGAARVEQPAPSFGRLLTAEVGPGGLWTVTQAQAGSTGLQVRRGDGATVETVPTPWYVNQARLAFAGSTPVLVYDRYGSVSEPLRVTRFVNGAWQPSTRVPGTWTVGGAYDVETARGRVHLVSTVSNASYRPQVAVWQGRAFGRHRPTGNNASCHASTHDLVTDRSGRLADVSRQCSQLAIANHPQRGASAVVRERFGGTPSGALAPQIATRADGVGRVVHSRSTPTGDVLLTTRVRLPALPRTVGGRRTAGGRATVRGPVTCLPASRTRVAVGAVRARGWRVVSRRLTRNGRAQGPVLDGRNLTPGGAYRLVGTVVLTNGNRRVTARAALTIRRCPTS